jgi:H+/gluconate symporter-like permease
MTLLISSTAYTPIVLLMVGILLVLGLIIGLKLNAFLALIISAIVVSLGVGLVNGQDAGSRLQKVVDSFGSAAGSIGIAIAMASIIGKCMLDSGAADRIVRASVSLTGERKASWGLMVSGFVLAIPVFFDTVFYLLVPLARSLYQQTRQNYLRYLMAIATGGAVTHTLVPPTPGPLLVAAILGVDIGIMMLIGILVAIPASIAGLLFAVFLDARMPVPMRALGAADDPQHQPLTVDQLPSLPVSLLPVLLPVALIGIGTLLTTLADREDRARIEVADVTNFENLTQVMTSAPPMSAAGRVLASTRLSADDRAALLQPATDLPAQQRVVAAINEALLDDQFYQEQSFQGVAQSELSKSMRAQNQLRMKPVDRRRMNRSLLQDALPDLFSAARWDSPTRRWADRFSLWSNANFALLLAAIAAMLILKRIRQLSWRGLGTDVESALLSGGVIILITAAGGAFGAMLQDTNISDTIKDLFAGVGAAGVALLLLGWGIAAVLKVAQGSSTVAMIVAAGMMSAIIGQDRPDFHLVYMATAIGTGSLMGSWMNDSGFWIFTKMGALTEDESLRSWTPLLMVLSVVGLAVTIVLSIALPLKAAL